MKCRLISLLAFLEILNIATSKDVEFQMVKTHNGFVKGYKAGNIFEFYGIPYASAPKGQDKYKAPLPAPSWLEPLDAVDKKVICVQPVAQMFGDDFEVTEDCLIANLFKPDTEDKKLPVVVYVHGGAYQIGWGNMLTPKSLVEQGNIIAVTFNYRVGVHGFLCLGTENVPGNAGMKDQVALLRWVKKNIASFGGDPDDVTLAGYSAGSSAADLLILSEMSRGLFNKVILESGAAPATWSALLDPVDSAKWYASGFGINTESIRKLEIFYTTTPLEELVTKTDIFEGTPNTTFSFVPCVERDTGSERFLKDAPVNILKNGGFPKYPMLIGFSNMEGKFRLNLFDTWKDQMNEQFSEFLPADLTFNSQQEKEEVANKINQFYFSDKPVSEDTVQGYVDFFTDVIFAYATLKTVQYQVEDGNENVYLYEYSYIDDNILAGSQLKIVSTVRGADHCAQTGAVLDPMLNHPVTVSEDYAKVRDMMRQLWINFVKSGKPVPEQTSQFPQGWPATSAEGSPHMSLNLSPELRGPLLAERAKLWDRVYKKFYRTPQPPQLAMARSDL